ncbi:hypothetical protein MLD38_000906 [Melastoma candidum]|uniref:Uncharacterized protein n=1 Tax=Melastoma candidum TaxID=119954 RepID=A0ACB9SCV0_9MYRT|nr:hypothetical protein MLD38_000906 [Melastoma candidum]
MDAEAVEEEKGDDAVEEKDCEEKVEKDADVNGTKDEKAVECEEKTEEKVEKTGEEKTKGKLGEGSNDVDKVKDRKEEVNVDEGEGSKEAKTLDKDAEEVKYPDTLEESEQEKNEEAEESQEEKKEEDHDEGQLQKSKEGKVSKKRLRRRSFGVRVRRDRKKERKEVEEKAVAKKEKTADSKKNKKEEKKKEKDEKENDRTPTIVDRPVRERKSVKRLVSIIDKDAHKEFKIEKGSRTPLKDIPNVASKLRRKNDDTLKLLHNILFGQRCKAFEIRGHISRFSGFVWHDDEEKRENKVKEKFDKCTKEKLLEICDVLDIQVSRASIMKEELVTTLIDFLVAPHATTTVLLAEKEKGSKAQEDSKLSKAIGKGMMSQKKNEDYSKGKSRKPQSDSDKDSEEEEEEEHENEVETENGVPEKSDDEMPDQTESEEKDVSKESGDDTRKRKSKAKSSGKKDSAGKAKNNKAVTVEKPKKPTSSRSSVEDYDRRVSSKEKEKGVKKSPTPTKFAGKKDAKGKNKSKDSAAKPSDEELRSAICEILKEVDFNTATFTDILKQLAKQFDIDLAPRKSSIKLMIQEELTKLADESDNEEDDGEGEPEKEEGNAGKDEAMPASTEVKAN